MPFIRQIEMIEPLRLLRSKHGHGALVPFLVATSSGIVCIDRRDCHRLLFYRRES
jgi:hypothetical protein